MLHRQRPQPRCGMRDSVLEKNGGEGSAYPTWSSRLRLALDGEGREDTTRPLHERVDAARAGWLGQNLTVSPQGNDRARRVVYAERPFASSAGVEVRA